MKKLRLTYTISFSVILLLNACCCGPDDSDNIPPFTEPCLPIILGPKNLSKKFNSGQFDKGNTMIFHNALNYTVKYTLDTVDIKYLKGSECDTTYLFEQRNAKYKYDGIAPKIEFDLKIIKTGNTEFKESYLVKIGDFFFSFINDNEIVKNYSSNSKLVYMESIQVFNTKLEKVYHLYFNNPKLNEINGIYYSLENGLMAFYIDDEHYWIKN
jgi:hypothetical protein